MPDTKPVAEDYLDEDPEIPGQKFVLLSFVSPEDVLARKEHFFFEAFLRDYEIQWKTKHTEAHLAKYVVDFNRKLEVASDKLEAAGQSEQAASIRAARMTVDDVVGGFQQHAQKTLKEITQTKIQDDYKDFMFRKEKELEDAFFKANEFRTTMRGLKVRGVYGSAEEASMRAKKLQRQDRLHNIYLGAVGKWVPWDPSPNAIQDQEYAEDQLNSLMKKYKENDEMLEQFYTETRQKRPEKKLLGMDGEEAGTSTEEASSHDGLFGTPGDLALQRKVAASMTVEENTLESAPISSTESVSVAKED